VARVIAAPRPPGPEDLTEKLLAGAARWVFASRSLVDGAATVGGAGCVRGDVVRGQRV